MLFRTKIRGLMLPFLKVSIGQIFVNKMEMVIGYETHYA